MTIGTAGTTLRRKHLLESSSAYGAQSDFAALAEPYRRELQVHCYRMLGSLQDAEDLVQETLLRAWQKLDTYEGRAPFRAWLYKIATNICLDALARRPRRALPPLVRPPADPAAPILPPVTEPIWLEPIPDDLLAETRLQPEARYAARESITLAFLASLQLLPPRQRAVLLLRDVLDWDAREAADLLDMSVPAVNSALHRARATMHKHYAGGNPDALAMNPDDEMTRALLDRYVHAWEAASVDELLALLKEDASFPMPPTPSWYQGHAAIREFVTNTILVGDSAGRYKLVPIRANGQPAFAWYSRDDTTGDFSAFGIHIVTIDAKTHLVSQAITFLGAHLFDAFNLPQTLTA